MSAKKKAPTEFFWVIEVVRLTGRSTTYGPMDAAEAHELAGTLSNERHATAVVPYGQVYGKV